MSVVTVFARLGSADHEFAAEEFLVVQFFDCALGFVDRLHRDEGETFRALIVAIAHDLGVLNVADAVEELEQIALGCIEGQIANVETRRSNFDRFGFALRPRFARLLLLLLLLTVTRLRNGFSLAAAVSDKKCGDALPKCFLLWSLRAWLLKAPAPAPSSRATAPLALASSV